MSLNSKNTQKYPSFQSSQNRGHGDFGQASYPQQYAFPTQLPTVPSNTPHDMNKQVAAGQPGMYPNSGGMPTAQQHHQSMGGPVPNPQPATLVQGQQMRANPMSMQSYYAARSSVPRTIPSMGRTPLQTVVNQAGQQPASHYGQIQMLPPFSPHPMQPVIVNHQFQQMYQQRPYSPPQNIIFPAATGQPVFLNNQWGGPHYNPPQPNSNGFYQSLPAYSNPIPPAQQITQQPVQAQKKTKALAIIDPVTGKSIFDGNNDEDSSRPTPEKETVSNIQKMMQKSVLYSSVVTKTVHGPAYHKSDFQDIKVS